MSRAAELFLADIGAALGIDVGPARFTGSGVLAAPFPMTDLGAACLASAGAAVARPGGGGGQRRRGRGRPSASRRHGRPAAGHRAVPPGRQAAARRHPVTVSPDVTRLPHRGRALDPVPGELPAPARRRPRRARHRRGRRGDRVGRRRRAGRRA